MSVFIQRAGWWTGEHIRLRGQLQQKTWAILSFGFSRARMDDQRTDRKSGGVVRAAVRLVRLTLLMYAGAEAGLLVQYWLPPPSSNDFALVAQSSALFLGAFFGLVVELWLRSDGLRSIRVSMRALFIAITIASMGFGWIIYICRK
jgi:hypothetical protein